MRLDCHCSIVAGAMLACLVGVGAAAGQTPAADQHGAPLRVWTDVTGKFHRTAALAEVRAADVLLRQASGRFTIIAWDKLSAADQEYARQFADRTAPQIASEPASVAAARVWTDATGTLRATATLAEVRGSSLVLVRPNGKLATASLEQLSPQDQEFVRALAGPAETIDGLADTRDGQAMRAAQAQLVASAPVALVPTWDQQSAPARVIHLQVSRRYLEHFVNRDVNTVEPVQDVIVGTPVSGTSRLAGHSRIALVPSGQQAIADIFFTGNSWANTVSNSGRAQISSSSTTNFQARKRVLLDAAGLHSLPTSSTACSSAMTCGVCSSLPGLRGAIARRVTARRTEESRGEANQESARHFERGLNREMDRDVAGSLAELDLFQKRFFDAARKGGLNLRSQASTTADELDIAVFRHPAELGQPDLAPPAIAGNPPAAIWIHNSFIQQVLANADLRNALQPLAEGFLEQGKPPGPDAATASPSDWKVGWTQDGSWMTVSFDLPGQHSPVRGASPSADKTAAR